MVSQCHPRRAERGSGPRVLPVPPQSPPGYRRRTIPQASALITCVDMVTPPHRWPPRHGRAGRPRSAAEGWHRFSTHLSAASFPSPSDRRPHRRAPGAAAPLRALPQGPPRRHFVRSAAPAGAAGGRGLRRGHAP